MTTLQILETTELIPADDLVEYMDEIRETVCKRCIERPAEGPPCAPLGKTCGIELHLPELIASIRQIQSDTIAPYLESNDQKICQSCAQAKSDACPCSMRTLAVLLVEAVEKVERRLAFRF